MNDKLSSENSRASHEGSGFQTEDSVKEHLVGWLHQQGWQTEVAWGRELGADIVAQKGNETWIIEVKGQGKFPQMRVNFFLAVLGEILQRMKESSAAYSIAFPDLKQYRNLWSRLPALAKQRVNLSALFVDSSGNISHDSIADQETSTGLTSILLFSPPEGGYFELGNALTTEMTKSGLSVLVIPKESVDQGIPHSFFGKMPLASLFLGGLRWQKFMKSDAISNCANPIVLTSNPGLLGSWQFNPVMGILPDQNAYKNLVSAFDYLKQRRPKFVSEVKEFTGLGFGWVRQDLLD